MSVTERERNAHSSPARRSGLLLRRLMIRCPQTGLPADTGFEITDLPRMEGGTQLLVDCLECGQDHPWYTTDAFLE